MPRVALYARYSSDNQRDASIEDQLRRCRQHAEQQRWTIIDSYSDRAISGASLLRPGVQDLIQDAARGRFDIVLAEAMDRLSRDQEDIAGLFKRLSFAEVRIVTLSEGDVTHLHVGFKGTMNALFLKDLADKTRRGLEGRVRAGQSGGGLCYGYDVVRQFDSKGKPIRGGRKINATEAAIVQRIFAGYAGGKSPRAIAFALNADGIPGPRTSTWKPSTINGNAERGTGILNNELYVGKLVWNRLRYVKDPDTGKRVSRANDADSIITETVPDLRIVDQDLWDRVKLRQGATTRATRPPKEHRFREHQRPRYLFAGLMRCGTCGGGYSKISKNLFGCSTARNTGACSNHLYIPIQELETRVLDGLRTLLLDPEIFQDFATAFVQEMRSLLAHENSKLTTAKAAFNRVDARLRKLVDAIVESVPA